MKKVPMNYKRLICLATAFTMTFGSVPADMPISTPFAIEASAAVTEKICGPFTVSHEDEVALITAEYDAVSGTVQIVATGRVTIKNTDSSTPANVTLKLGMGVYILDGVNIDASALSAPAVTVYAGTIRLKGTNTLKGGENCAGLKIAGDVTITSESGNGITSGTLSAYGGTNGAGIEVALDSAALTINGGTIYAEGGEYSAGIGGNYTYPINGRNITITGGNIKAIGGENAAGIGGGGAGGDGINITITGGTVYAMGGKLKHSNRRRRRGYRQRYSRICRKYHNNRR